MSLLEPLYILRLQHFPNLFGQPVVCLLSPEQVPTTMQGKISCSKDLIPLLLHKKRATYVFIFMVYQPTSAEQWWKCSTLMKQFVPWQGLYSGNSLTFNSNTSHDAPLRFIIKLRFMFLFVSKNLKWSDCHSKRDSKNTHSRNIYSHLLPWISESNSLWDCVSMSPHVEIIHTFLYQCKLSLL